ncbi:MAG TPA: hypothetical protein PLB21_13960, partial [Actinomycetota bacterium]|nr:hypothetical protein [Actinomycetota bacterium]
MSFSSTGDRLAVVGQFPGVILINPIDLTTSQIPDAVYYERVAFLKGLNLVAVGGWSTPILKIYDPAGGLVFEATLPGGVRSLAWNDSKQLLAVGMSNAEIRVFGVDGDRPTASDFTLSPALGFARGTTFQLSVVLSDASSGIKDVSAKARVRDANGALIQEIVLNRGAGDTFTGTWDSTGFEGNLYVVGVYVEDNTGNVYESAQGWPIDFVAASQIVPPVLTSVTSSSTTAADLVWTYSSTNHSGFRVERSTDATTWIVVTSLAGTGTSFADVGLQPGTLYYYRLQAFNAGAISYSNVRSVVTQYPTPDLQGPSLIVTSHTSGQRVSAAFITLAGAASDAGLGERGVTSVTINGQRALNDVAAAGATASWSLPLDLGFGQNQLTVVATDASPLQNRSQVVLTLNWPGPLFIGTGATLPTGLVGQDRDWPLQAIGASAPYVWSLVSSVLPPGLALQESGVIGGAPAVAGAHAFRLRVSSAGGGTAEQDFSILVCSAALEAASESFGFTGGSATVSMSMTDACAWFAASSAPWIRVTSGLSGTGSSIVGYLVDENPGPA